MAEQPLNGADIVAVLEQVGGEGMAEGVGANALIGDAGGFGCTSNGFLQGAGIGVVAAGEAGARVDGEAIGWEGILPGPSARGVGKLEAQCVGQVDIGVPSSKVVLEGEPDVAQVASERGDDGFGQDGGAILEAFGLADDDLPVSEVEIFEAQADAFHEAQAAAVEELSHQKVGAGEVLEDGLDFAPGEDGWDAFRAAGAQGVDRQVEFDLEDVLGEEEQGG